MKIAMIGHKRMPSREGGIEVVVEELSTRIAALGNEVTVFNRTGHHVAGAEFDNEKTGMYRGVHIRTVPTIKKRGFAAISAAFFASLFSALGDYDIVHIHAEGPARFAFLLKIFHKKVIVTIHGLDWKREKWGRFAGRLILSGEKAAVKYADAIIVLNHSSRFYFKKKYGRETYYIPNGVTRPVVREASEITKKWGLYKDSYVLFVGRMVPEKGLESLIKAWKHVKTDKKLVIAGSPSDTEEYARQVMREADERTIFTGFVQDTLLDELYSNAYLYCLPSSLEGMPLTLMEAMSYGNCCLTSDIPECTDVVGRNAVHFEKGNLKDFSDKLQFLIDHKDFVNQLREKSADYICKRYSWDDVTKQTLTLYSKVLNRKDRSSCGRMKKNKGGN